ncbi:hypothetical protein JHK87_022511 [Glycine soja]|nr:hypothetical protein JHK87_022511 [Glycine soja]
MGLVSKISRCHGAILEGSQSHAIHAMFEELTDVDFVKIDVNELPMWRKSFR